MNPYGVFLLVFVCQIITTATLASKPLTKCNRNSYRKLGCFGANSKPLPELLITDRDKRSDKYDGHKIMWNDWEKYLHSLACRCAEKARNQNLKVFGLQNYGECWSGPDADKNYDRDGRSDKCIMNFELPPPCDLDSPIECMGVGRTNYIYRLVELEPEDECSKSPCRNGATCINTAGGFRCACPQGFKGALCDQDEDECAKSPCKNGGSCTNTEGGFTCTCQQGFQGKLCDQDINECESKPCKNGGACVNTLGNYLCKCIPGFTGTHCEQDVDECAKSPCKNGGSCTNTVGGFTCKCQQGFQGKLCDQDVDECAKSPCKNGGSCTNTVGGFTCTCQQGFQGKLCDQDINECKSKPCKNGGTCVNTLGNYLCKCIPGFTGTHCEQVVDPCQSNPCQHGGRCERDGNGFKCKCVTGFTGTHCEKDIDECQQSPCGNGGTCVNTLGSFHCLCPAGFQGKLCKQGFDACSQFKPCKNGARCENKQGGFKCLCPSGITGMLCDKDIDECRQSACLNGGRCVNTPGSFHCTCRTGYSGKHCEKGGCSTPADRYDVGLVIDGSGSVGNQGFVETKMFLLKLVDQFTVSAEKTHFGVIVYSNDPILVSQLSSPINYHPIQLKLRILYVEFPDGKTRTDKALKMAGTELYAQGEDRNLVPNVLVVITDGKTGKGSEPYNKVLRSLKEHHVSIIAVGIGSKVSRSELREIAMGREDRVLQVNSMGDLTYSFSKKLSDMIKNSC